MNQNCTESCREVYKQVQTVIFALLSLERVGTIRNKLHFSRYDMVRNIKCKFEIVNDNLILNTDWSEVYLLSVES